MDWIKSLAKLAPTAASLIGGPFAGIAIQALGTAFGISEPTQAKIETAFKSGQLNGDQLVALKLAEQNLALKLEELGVKREELEYADTKSARDMQIATGSWVPGVLALFVTLGFFGILGWMLHAAVSPSEPLLVMLGSLGTAWASIVGFYFGSSHGSQAKNNLLANK